MFAAINCLKNVSSTIRPNVMLFCFLQQIVKPQVTEAAVFVSYFANKILKTFQFSFYFNIEFAGHTVRFASYFHLEEIDLLSLLEVPGA